LTPLEAFDNKPKRLPFSRARRPPTEAEVLLPSQEAFEDLATRGNLVPVVREVLAGLHGLRTTLPAGTLSGAPSARALIEAIDMAREGLD
jgi:hypothetical protein